MVGIVTRATELASVAQRETQRSGLADLYLQPPLSMFKLFEYGRGSEIAEVGYQHAAERLSASRSFLQRSCKR
jgi:hypothetical protein